MNTSSNKGVPSQALPRNVPVGLARQGLLGPFVQCSFKNPESGATSSVKVVVIKLFQDNFTCVRAVDSHVTFGRDGCWLVRNGIHWPDFLSGVLFRYRGGLRVPWQFIPLKRIPDEILAAGEKLHGRAIVPFFTRLRQTNFLPALPSLKASTCPPQLKWKTLRRDFQSF